MKKRRKSEEAENPDRWVVSYADFITLLFAFFTTLYAISQVDTGKLEMFSGSMKSAFKSDQVRAVTPVIEGILPVRPDVIGIENEFRKAIATLRTRDDIELRRDERGVVISLGDNLLFDVGQAVVKKDAVSALTAIVSIIKKIPNNLTIEGHTDNVPINNPDAKYLSNWELSAARATSVLAYLLKNHNLSPDRFSAAGYAEFKPVKTNTTPEGRAKNRRVDIIVLNINNK